MSAMPDSAVFTANDAANGEPTPTLSRLEWHVVALALREASNGGCGGVLRPSAPRRALQRLLRTLIGWEGPRPLADPRLETLRRFVCTSRWGHSDAASLAQSLVQQGFSQGQVRAVAMLVGR